MLAAAIAIVIRLSQDAADLGCHSVALSERAFSGSASDQFHSTMLAYHQLLQWTRIRAK